MNFGAAQVEKLSWGSPPRLLGVHGLTAATFPQRPGAPALQLLGKRPDKGGDGIDRTGFLPNVRAREAMRQGMSKLHPIAGEWPHPGAIHQAMPPGTTAPAIGTGTSPYRVRLTGPVQFLRKVLDTWELDSTDATVLLGMDPDDRSYAADVLAGRAILKGRDAKDRIAQLYRIRKMLSALFRDQNVENQWLREPHTMLDESSPMDLMLDGSMENLLLVREFVEAAAGR